MLNVSYGIFTIFIAFVLFSMIKNVFFNANQLSRNIRRKYLTISIVYLFIFVLGISTVVVASNDIKDDNTTFINLDFAFLFMSLPMIFTSIRMDANDTSAYNKWYYSQPSPGEYKGDSKETKTMIRYYFLNIILGAIPIAWLGFFVNGPAITQGCVIGFIVLAFIFIVMTIIINMTSLGELIRKNMLYNYLWEKLQRENIDGDKGIIKETATKLFKELFTTGAYSGNSEMNNQILKWIKP